MFAWGLAKNLQEDVKNPVITHFPNSNPRCTLSKTCGGFGVRISLGSISSLEIADCEVITLWYCPSRLIVNSASFHTHFVYSAYRRLSGPREACFLRCLQAMCTVAALRQQPLYRGSLRLGVCEVFRVLNVSLWVCFAGGVVAAALWLPPPKPTSHLNTSAVGCKTSEHTNFFPPVNPLTSLKTTWASQHTSVCVCASASVPCRGSSAQSYLMWWI